MKLSMWMIANRLSLANPEMKIQDNATATLKSARRVYATDCVYVFQRNCDVVCMNEENYLILKDMELDEAFETVQSVFDFYNDWYIAVMDAAIALDYQKILDLSWHIFHNPMILSDANNKLLAYSHKYKDVKVDSEWEHLIKYGYSSVSTVQFMRREAEHFNFFSTKANVFRMAYQIPIIIIMYTADGLVCWRRSGR